MSKNKITIALASAAMLASLAPAALPSAAMAQSRANGVTNCDAPGGRQRTGALIGGLLGAVVGSQVSDNERTLGAVVGAGAGAAAGSYIGCNQQRARSYNSTYRYSDGDTYRATSNLRIRSGPGTGYRQVGSLSAGQPFTAVSSQGEWVQIAGGGWVNAHYVSR